MNDNKIIPNIGSEITKVLAIKAKEIVNQPTSTAPMTNRIYYQLGLRHGKEDTHWEMAIKKYDLQDDQKADFLQGYTNGENSKNNFALWKDILKCASFGLATGAGIYGTAKLIALIFGMAKK